jgi:hypothetical protein
MEYRAKKDEHRGGLPFSLSKRAVVPFFVVKWPPNQIIVVTLKGDNGSDSDWKMAPDILDKNKKWRLLLKYWGMLVF